MPNKYPRQLYPLTCLFIIFFLALNTACQFQRGRVSQIKPTNFKPRKIVVVGFRPAMSQDEDPGVIRSPVSGAVFMAEPIPQDVTDKMTSKLFSRLVEYEGYELIGPNKATGAIESLLSSDKDMSDIEIFHRVGQLFSADAVIVGYIFRWRDRDGTEYSVNRPASAAFELDLLRPEDNAIMWKGRFDKTQTSLSENLLDMETFIKGKGQWMTVDRLAELGLDDLLDNFFLASR